MVTPMKQEESELGRTFTAPGEHQVEEFPAIERARTLFEERQRGREASLAAAFTAQLKTQAQQRRVANSSNSSSLLSKYHGNRVSSQHSNNTMSRRGGRGKVKGRGRGRGRGRRR
mmetsp:Transcript_1021/g.2002  ORF Transcript_1021/g.2002 Transcript_1021/m.2002 type:complete len:115 (+) Transcript_1021:484-828(+)